MIAEHAGLAERARAGDVAALHRLLALCRPDLERYARRHCESDDVEEAIQDALWILYRKLGALRSVAALTGWLFQIVRRACRAAGRRPRFASLDELPHAAERDHAASDPELRADLSIIIAGLPGPYRAILVLKDVQGFSAEEAAVRLGISAEAAKSRLHRARAMVRNTLAPRPGVRVAA